MIEENVEMLYGVPESKVKKFKRLANLLGVEIEEVEVEPKYSVLIIHD